MRNTKFISKIALLALLAISSINSSFAATYEKYEDDSLNINEMSPAKKGFYIKGFYNTGKVNSELNPNYKGVFEEGKKLYTGYNISKTKTDNSLQTNVQYYMSPSQEYKALYKSLQGGGSALGYYISDNFKIEAEGVFGSFGVQPQNILPSLPTGEPFYFLQDPQSSYFYSISNRDGQTNTNIGTGPWPVQYQNKGSNYLAGMLNAYYDFSAGEIIKPYIGVGAGVAKLTFKARPEVSSPAAALQGKIGVLFETGGTVTPYLGYKMLFLFPRAFSLNSYIIGGWTPDDKMDNRAEDWSKRTTPLTTPFNIKIAPSYLLHNLEVGLIISL